MIKREIFKIEDNKVVRQRKPCPKCGDGVFLAQHKDRVSCGTCGYTEFKGRVKKEPETAPINKEDKVVEKPNEVMRENESSTITGDKTPESLTKTKKDDTYQPPSKGDQAHSPLSEEDKQIPEEEIK